MVAPATALPEGRRCVVGGGGTLLAMSTRRLIILSLLCGVAILAAFVVQLALVL